MSELSAVLIDDEVLMARTAVRRYLAKMRTSHRREIRQGKTHFAETHLRKFDDYLDLYERLGGDPDEIRDPESIETGEGVGTGAGEGMPRQDTGSAWVTRSADCPEAPAQAHFQAASRIATDARTSPVAPGATDDANGPQIGDSDG